MSETTERRVRVNGRLEPLRVSTIADLFTERVADLGQRGIAIALNGSVIPRAAWADTTLKPGDTIEIVRAMQGG
jgi:sulfur carrier protein